MPKILARDPAWLDRSTPASRLFKADSEAKGKTVRTLEHEGASRRVAHRGSEIFVAVGNELRWSELGLLKDAGEDLERTQRDAQEDGGERLYRVRLLRITC